MFEKYLNHVYSELNKGKLDGEISKLKSEIKGLENLVNNSDEPQIMSGARFINLDDIPDDLPPMIKAVFDKIKKIELLDDLTQSELENRITEEFNEALGEPTEEQIVKKDGITIDRKIWDLNDSERFTKISKQKTPKVNQRTVEVIKEELKIAVEDEKFELAARLRDEISTMESVENQPKKKKSKK